LELLDCRTETRKIALSRRRQDLHEDEPAEVSGRRFVKGRKFGERSALVRAMHSLSAWIKNNQHTPTLRKRHAADNRRGGGRRSPSAIDNKTAPMEQADADAGACTAAESDRIASNVERHSMQATQSGRHRKCDLCAGTETRMGRYDLLDCDRMGATKTEKALHDNDMMSHPISLGTRDLCARRCSDRDLGPWTADGEADAAEGAAQPSVEIQKAEMQPRRNNHGSTRLNRRRCAGQPSSPEIFRSSGFSKRNSGLECGIWNWLAISGELHVYGIGRHAMTEASKERTYSDAEIKERLERDLPHWYLEGGWIRRKYRTHSWKGTLMLINTVGHLAEAAWHHPDITASYAWVEVRLHNHAAKGITDKDFQLARKIEDVVHWQPGKEGGALEGTPEKDQRFAYIKYDT
jgi:4a-hydroxytetrahydrobiopterin dehydratase